MIHLSFDFSIYHHPPTHMLYVFHTITYETSYTHLLYTHLLHRSYIHTYIYVLMMVKIYKSLRRSAVCVWNLRRPTTFLCLIPSSSQGFTNITFCKIIHKRMDDVRPQLPLAYLPPYTRKKPELKYMLRTKDLCCKSYRYSEKDMRRSPTDNNSEITLNQTKEKLFLGYERPPEMPATKCYSCVCVCSGRILNAQNNACVYHAVPQHIGLRTITRKIFFSLCMRGCKGNIQRYNMLFHCV